MLVKKIISQLTKKKKTLSVAESCSGGLLSHQLTNVPGSSNVFMGGVVAYSNAAKSSLLDISPSLLKKYGAVSREVATQMAKNACKVFKTDFGVGISGIAGPSGGSKAKPVGLVFIAIAWQNKAKCFKYHFNGSRKEIKAKSVKKALKKLASIA